MKLRDGLEFLLVIIGAFLLSLFIFNNHDFFDEKAFTLVEKIETNGSNVSLITSFGQFNFNYTKDCSSIIYEKVPYKAMIYPKDEEVKAKLFFKEFLYDKNKDVSLNELMCLHEENSNLKIFVKKEILERKMEKTLNVAYF